ncbi:MAG: hypothetical protein V1908_04435, partial [Candidatus Peregrinibacteria bacterium]
EEANLSGLVDAFERNEMQALETMSVSELAQIRERLETLHRTFGPYAEQFGVKIDQACHPENLSDGQKATEAIGKIKHAISAEEIRTALKTFGPIAHADDKIEVQGLLDRNAAHVITVTHRVFKAEYGRYTATGSMVFYERNEHWGIILDEETMQDPEKLIQLREELTHELRHLEFERTEGASDKQLAIYRENPKWTEIQEAYVAAYPTKTPPDWKPNPPKKTYTLEDWNAKGAAEKHIASELYAMTDEKSETKVFDDSPLGRFNTLMAGMGAVSLGKDAVPDAHMEEYIRGSEHGGGGRRGGGDEVEESHAASPGSSGGGSYEKFKDDIDFREKELKELRNSEYVNFAPGVANLLHLMQNYLEEAKRMNEMMKRAKEKGYLGTRIGQMLTQLKEDTSTINITLGEAGSNIPNQKISLFSRFWISTHVLSITDIIKAGKDVVEFFKREHERKEGENAARLGMALFGNTDLARESKAQYYKAEEHNVEEWQKRYEHLDAWELMEIIDGIAESPIPSKHQMKALLRILAKKGRIDWRHEGLWKALNKMQTAVHFTPGDQVMLHNPTLMRQKLHTALGKIWDFDEFLKLNRENEDAYEGNKKKFEPIMDAIQDQLTLKMEQLLKKHRENPHHSRVSPEEYEEALIYAIEKGKSNAEAVMFYLIVGQAEGILRSDRGMVIDKLLNTWPGTQWIYHMKPPLTQQDYRNYAMKYFRHDYESGTVGWDFKNFYVNQVMHDEMYVQRVRKSVSERGWDHDWCRTIIAEGEASTVKRWLQGRSGNEEVKDTAIENGIVGLLMTMEESARAPDSIDYRKHFKRMLGNFAMMDSVLNNVCPNQPNMASFTRMKPSIANSHAREGELTHHGNWQVHQHMKKMQDFLRQFDPVLFGPDLMGNQYRSSHEPDALAVDIRTYLIEHYPAQATSWRNIKTLYQVFERIEEIIDAVISTGENADDEVFKRKIKTLRHGIDESEYHSSGGGHGHGGDH